MLSATLFAFHAFLAPVNPAAAAKVIKQLVVGAERLLTYPQLGVLLFAPRYVRRVVVGDYELRYECLRVWIISFGFGIPGKIVNVPALALLAPKRGIVADVVLPDCRRQ